MFFKFCYWCWILIGFKILIGWWLVYGKGLWEFNLLFINFWCCWVFFLEVGLGLGGCLVFWCFVWVLVVFLCWFGLFVILVVGCVCCCGFWGKGGFWWKWWCVLVIGCVLGRVGGWIVWVFFWLVWWSRVLGFGVWIGWWGWGSWGCCWWVLLWLFWFFVCFVGVWGCVVWFGIGLFRIWWWGWIGLIVCVVSSLLGLVFWCCRVVWWCGSWSIGVLVFWVWIVFCGFCFGGFLRGCRCLVVGGSFFCWLCVGRVVWWICCCVVVGCFFGFFWFFLGCWLVFGSCGCFRVFGCLGCVGWGSRGWWLWVGGWELVKGWLVVRVGGVIGLVWIFFVGCVDWFRLVMVGVVVILCFDWGGWDGNGVVGWFVGGIWGFWWLWCVGVLGGVGWGVVGGVFVMD